MKKIALIAAATSMLHAEPNLLHQKIINEYPPDYCLLLEEIYGTGMMSEGEGQATEHMFEGVALQEKTALDFGCGLGGMATYLAQEHAMHITGLDINPWMIAQAEKRIPKNIQSQLRYVCSTSDETLPFADNQFDIIYSKGVLTHLENKQPVFKEFKRILKPNGTLVILDCLSPVQGQWGPHISQMASIEDLTMFAETEERYLQLLENAGFDIIATRDDSRIYTEYNKEICRMLREEKKDTFLQLLGKKAYQENLEGYEAIVKAFETEELFMLRFIAS